MGKVKWTPEQKSAIETKDKELLLSAAAGSGKTAVLVERITKIITDRKNPVFPDELLVLTFSKAAANEMKQRIIKRVADEEKNERIREEITPEEREQNLKFLRQQKRLLNHAQISTIHVFCKNLIEENFFSLDISPDFRIADEKESQVIFNESLTEVIEGNYEKENNEDFLKAVDLISKGRDDSSLKKTLADIYKNIRSYPFYIEWMQERMSDFDIDMEVGKTPWGEIIFNFTEKRIDYALSLNKKIYYEIENFVDDDLDENAEVKFDDYRDNYFNVIVSDRIYAQNIKNACIERNWDKAFHSIVTSKFDRWPSVKKYSQKTKDFIEKLKKLRDDEKAVLKDIADKNLFYDSDLFKLDNDYTKNLMGEIFEIIKEIDKVYLENKFKKKLLDFSDLEHFALKLLVIKDEKGERPSELALNLCEKYKEILVDEYQDTNFIQEKIFRSISYNGKKMFMVGDVKQSIYSFRQARPELFLNKKNKYPLLSESENSESAKIILAKNFRSCREVTEGINYIFSLIMQKGLGGISYGLEDSLIYNDDGRKYSHKRGCEFDIIDASKLKEDDEFDRRENEAHFVADRIKELISEEFPIKDGDIERPVRLSDIAILMRSVKGKAETYQKVLTESGIPTVYNSDSQFLNTLEIKAVTSLLKSLDNPLLDDELYNAVMSPLFGFTADEMAEISLEQTESPLYSRMYLKKDEISKCGDFISKFNYLRKCAVSMSVSDLILEIYDITGFETVVQAGPNGKIAVLNLKLLANYADGIGSGNHEGLSGFIRYINKLTEAEGDLPSAQINSKTENTVQIMSIHASKGLEFPIVFLVDTSSKFNKRDLSADTILHPKLGFATKRRDNKLGVKYTTAHYNAIKILKENDLLSEEMRILYVALTRAKEKLIIAGSSSTPIEKLWEKLNVNLSSENKIEEVPLSSCICYMDWILSALCHHKDVLPICEKYMFMPGEIINDKGDFKISVINPKQDEDENIITTNEEKTFEENEEILEKLFKRRDFIYSDIAQTRTPTKFAISSIGRNENDKKLRKTPSFIKENKMTGAEKGNALHKFMQFADFSALERDIEDEIYRLESNEYLTETEGEAVEAKVSKIRDFVESDLFKRIKNADKMYREYDFIAEVGNEVLGKYTNEVGEGCYVTVQGIADCIIIENGYATVIDYKTDNVKDESQLLERYGTQLKLYQELLTESLGYPVKEAVIYSFKLSREIRL